MPATVPQVPQVIESWVAPCPTYQAVEASEVFSSHAVKYSLWPTPHLSSWSLLAFPALTPAMSRLLSSPSTMVGALWHQAPSFKCSFPLVFLFPSLDTPAHVTKNHQETANPPD